MFIFTNICINYNSLPKLVHVLPSHPIKITTIKTGICTNIPFVMPESEEEEMSGLQSLINLSVENIYDMIAG